MNELSANFQGQFDRLPPSDMGAEMCAIASMILDRSALREIVEIVGRDDWYQADHQAIFDVLLEMDAKGKAIDLVILADELRSRQVLEDVGGVAYLSEIVGSVPSSANGVHYANIVREKSRLRQLIATGNGILRRAYSASSDESQVQIDAAESAIYAIAQKQITGHAEPFRIAVEDTFEAITSEKGQRGLECGYFDLDEILNGLHEQDMIVVAARPSMGKTAMVMGILDGLARKNHTVALFSMEMGKSALAQRALTSAAKVDSHRLRRGMLGKKEYDALAAAANDLGKLPIYVDDSPMLTPLQLRSKARHLKLKHDIKVLAIDYMQLMDARTQESRQQQITEISRGLKALARELSIPIIAVSQLNRQSESRTDHRPRMSDLRESGSIEQDADVILLLHREDYYRMTDKDFTPDNIVEVIVAKQRNGPTGVVRLYFDGRSTRFDNLDTNSEPPDEHAR